MVSLFSLINTLLDYVIKVFMIVLLPCLFKPRSGICFDVNLSRPSLDSEEVWTGDPLSLFLDFSVKKRPVCELSE